MADAVLKRMVLFLISSSRHLLNWEIKIRVAKYCILYPNLVLCQKEGASGRGSRKAPLAASQPASKPKPPPLRGGDPTDRIYKIRLSDMPESQRQRQRFQAIQSPLQPSTSSAVFLTYYSNRIDLLDLVARVYIYVAVERLLYILQMQWAYAGVKNKKV